MSRSGEVRDHQEDRPGEDYRGEINHETEYIKIHQNQYTDKLLMRLLRHRSRFPRSNDAQAELEKENPTSEFGLDLRYSERQHATFSERHLK